MPPSKLPGRKLLETIGAADSVAPTDIRETDRCFGQFYSAGLQRSLPFRYLLAATLQESILYWNLLIITFLSLQMLLSSSQSMQFEYSAKTKIIANWEMKIF